jgi:hemolysin III
MDTSDAAVRHPGPDAGPPTPPPPTPRQRGRLHQAAFVVSIPAGAALVAIAEGGRARATAAVFAVGLTGLYGVSAAYHRGRWSDAARKVMKHLDHAMIFVFIAASYTPLALLALRSDGGTGLVVAAWCGAAVGVLVTVLRLERWHRIGFALYLVLGWLAVVALPRFAEALSGPQLGLLLTGGLLYTVGAVVLATRRPDPRPEVFGYHEVWHTFVVAASSCHFVLVAQLVRP